MKVKTFVVKINDNYPISGAYKALDSEVNSFLSREVGESAKIHFLQDRIEKQDHNFLLIRIITYTVE